MSYVRGKLLGIISVINIFNINRYYFIYEKLIMNPNNEDTTVDIEYYGINVAENILKYIKFIWCCCGIGTLIGLSLITSFEEKKHGKGLCAPKEYKKKYVEEEKTDGKKKFYRR